jgi:hypothetical protein
MASFFSIDVLIVLFSPCSPFSVQLLLSLLLAAFWQSFATREKKSVEALKHARWG